MCIVYLLENKTTTTTFKSFMFWPEDEGAG